MSASIRHSPAPLSSFAGSDRRISDRCPPNRLLVQKNWTPVPQNGIICQKTGGGVHFFRVEWLFFAHLSFSARSGRATAGNIYEYAMTTERDIRNQIRYAEKKGIEKEALAIARRMLEDNEPIEKIVKYSGLTEEQIKNL